VINVREVIETHSQSTTLRELEAKGRSKVRVINASEIAKLVEDSVRQAMANAKGDEGVQQLIEKSKTEFREIKRQRDEEHAAREEGKLQLEKARKELLDLHQQIEDMRAKGGDAPKRAADLETALSSERKRSEEMRALVDAITKERDLARESEIRALEAAKAVNATIPTNSQGDVLAKLADQVAKLGERLEKGPQGVHPAAPMPASDLGALQQRLDAMTNGIAERLEKFGRSVGVSSAVDAPDVKLDAIFNQNEKLENNLGTVEAKKQKGTGIGGALDRMKKMRMGSAGAAPKDANKDEGKQ
jgi:hypothetical protein